MKKRKLFNSAENLFFNIYFQFFPLSFSFVFYFFCSSSIVQRRIKKRDYKLIDEKFSKFPSTKIETKNEKNLRFFFFCLFLSPRYEKKGMKHERNRKFSNLFSSLKSERRHTYESKEDAQIILIIG
jgi:hypothetical protein